MSNVLKWKARVQPAPSSSNQRHRCIVRGFRANADHSRVARFPGLGGIPVGRGGRWGSGSGGGVTGVRSAAKRSTLEAAAAAVYSGGCDDEVEEGIGLQGEEQKKLLLIVEYTLGSRRNGRPFFHFAQFAVFGIGRLLRDTFFFRSVNQ